MLFFESYDFKEPSVPPESDPENEKLRLLHQAIAGLDKVEKAIILLYLDGIDNAEIAAIIGISQNYVRVKTNRIKKKLSQRLILK